MFYRRHYAPYFVRGARNTISKMNKEQTVGNIKGGVACAIFGKGKPICCLFLYHLAHVLPVQIYRAIHHNLSGFFGCRRG